MSGDVPQGGLQFHESVLLRPKLLPSLGLIPRLLLDWQSGKRRNPVMCVWKQGCTPAPPVSRGEGCFPMGGGCCWSGLGWTGLGWSGRQLIWHRG